MQKKKKLFLYHENLKKINMKKHGNNGSIVQRPDFHKMTKKIKTSFAISCVIGESSSLAER